MTPRRKLRLAVIINASWNFVNFRAGLLRALVEDRHQLLALAPDETYRAEIEAMGLAFATVPIDSGGTSPLRDLRTLLAIRRALGRFGADAVLTFTPKPNIYGGLAARWLGIALLPNVAGLGVAFAKGSRLAGVVTALYRRALRRAPTVFFQDSADRDAFVARRIVRSDQVRVLPGSGIDLARFRAQPLPRGGPITFLFCSRLLRSKGVEAFVAAGELLKSGGADARFQIAGFAEAEHPDAVADAALAAWERGGTVELLGRLEDVRPAIAGSHCVVLPSAYPEGTPRILLEACAMGRPIITTDTPGCRDLVTDGDSGLLCDAADGHSVANAMLRVISMGDEARQRMGSAARCMVEARYDEAMVIDAYRSALGAIGRASA